MPAPHPWLSHYPPGVPAEIPGIGSGSLAALLEEAFEVHARREACIFMEKRHSFRELGEWSGAFAAWLQAQGLAQGARVALMMPNLPQYLVALAGVLRAGFVVVNVNPLYTARELEHQLRDSGAEACVVLENFAATLEEVLDRTNVRHVVLVSVGDLMGLWRGALVNFAVRHVRKQVPEFRLPLDGGRSVARFNEVLAAGAGLPLKRPRLGPDDVAFLQYTGGTTGVSKGAMLLHRNVVSNVLQCEAWFAPTLREFGGRPLLTVCALPLYHIFALTVCALLGARLGMTLLLIPNPRDIPGFVGTLARHRVHMFPAVNTLYAALLADPDFARLDFSELRVCNGGGMAVHASTAERWLAATGCPIVEGYGLSETSPVATCNRLDERVFRGTIGLPVPNTEISIRDDQGQELPLGAAGEICIQIGRAHV